MSKPSPLSRRMFLRAASGAALGIPLLESLLPRGAQAQTASPAVRFIAMRSYSGQVAKLWYPTSTPAGYQLRDAVFSDPDKKDGTTYLPTRLGTTRHSIARLSDFAGPAGISSVLGPALNPYVNKLNLLRGLDMMQTAGHNGGATFGNYAESTQQALRSLSQMPTIDRVMAYSPKLYPTAPTLRALDLGTGSPSSFSFTDYGIRGGAVEQVSFLLDPKQAWDKAFGAFMGPAQPMANPNASLMNAIHGDYARLSQHRRISAADKALLERHMTFLDEIERKLQILPPSACTAPAAPRSIPNYYPWDQISSVADFNDTVRLMAEVAVAAIKCDVTRVVTFDVQKALTDVSGTWKASYHNSGDVQGDWHQFAHDLETDPNSRANFLAISKWICNTVFAKFCELLDVEEANGKTYLDNSLICWGNELGYSHYNTDMMTLLAGGAGGRLKTGNYIDYIDWNHSYANPINAWGVLIPGLPHNRLLVTLLQAMGLSPADYERDGIAGYGHHDYIETPYNWPKDYDLTQIGMPLPGLMA
jgi:hypothetical protein